MLELAVQPSILGDELVLRSIDWLENFPWRQENCVTKEKDGYEVCLHVKDFAPEEITVKTSDGFIVVKAKHEEKKDEYGYVSRQFVRKFLLPDGCRPEDVKSKLSSDGLLKITVPRQPVSKHDTVIQVSHEGNSKSKL